MESFDAPFFPAACRKGQEVPEQRFSVRRQDGFRMELNAVKGEVPVAEHGDWIGRPIKELGIPAEVLIVLVRRADGTTVVPKGGTVLQQGDMLVVNEWEET